MSHSPPRQLLYYIQIPVIEMRESPSFQSKVVSQAIFSEKIALKTTRDSWSYISTPDGYLGWIPTQSYIVRQSPYLSDIEVCRRAAHLYSIPDIEYGPLYTLSYGSHLQTIAIFDDRWIKVALPDDSEAYIQKGDVHFPLQFEKKQDLVPLSYQFLNLPYTWGGRSSFGYDCSGFVQMLYQHLNIKTTVSKREFFSNFILERDARLQINDPRFRSIDLDQLEPGDLLFFGDSPKEIKHVGMYLNEGRFIHATSKENQPWIRISSLSDAEWSGKKGGGGYPFRFARQLF